MNNNLRIAITGIDSREEMNEAIRLIKVMQKRITSEGANDVKSWIRPGMKVNVRGRRSSLTEIGTVERIKIKKAVVDIDGVLWDCPLDMLTKVA